MLWKEKNIRIPPDEIGSQNSGKFCENKEKFWVLNKDKYKMINCKYVKMGNTFPARFKEEGYYDL